MPHFRRFTRTCISAILTMLLTEIGGMHISLDLRKTDENGISIIVTMLSAPISWAISIVEPSAVANNKHPFIKNFILPVPDASCPAVLHKIHVFRHEQLSVEVRNLYGIMNVRVQVNSKHIGSHLYQLQLAVVEKRNKTR